jgi:protein-S-isoprenylcysteine O-methyltransferase Ste14
MRINATAHPPRMPPAWSAAARAARLSIFGLLGWFWFLAADDSAWRDVAVVAALGFAALVGVAWYLAHARAESRWRAVLDRYAEREQAKRTYSWRRHR